MGADKVDRADVEAKIEAREQARAKLQKELALMELDMKQVLTPEQREKVMQFREENRQKMIERRKAMRSGAQAPADNP
jgi:Spy/CpxP family protein refolding chaperone